MQTLKLFVYDEFCSLGMFERLFFTLDIIKTSYAFTYGLLRYQSGRYHFYKSKRHKVIFGRYYEITLKEGDLEHLRLYYGAYSMEEIDVTLLKDVKDITTCDFQIDKKIKVYTHTSNYTSLRENRHANVGNLSKYLLI